MLINYIQKNPLVGMVTPVLCTVTVALTDMLTNDVNIKLLGGISLCLGILVGFFTLMIKAIEWFERILLSIHKFKKWRLQNAKETNKATD